MENKIKIVFFGTPDFAVKILTIMKVNDLSPHLIITAPDKRSGRGLKLTPPPAKVWAVENGISFLQPVTLKDEGLTARIAESRPDIFVVASYGKIIPESMLALPAKGALNVHPSLLPKYRGASPIHGAMLAGEKHTGATIILLDAEMDHGSILAQRKLSENINQTRFVELEARLADLGGELLVETIPRWISGDVAPRAQDHAHATYTKKIAKEDGRIDWRDLAPAIARRVLALNPWPGTFSFWRRGNRLIRLIITDGYAETGGGRRDVTPGTVFEHNGKMAVSAGGGFLIVAGIKPEGRQEITSQEFLRGNKDILGAVLEPV